MRSLARPRKISIRGTDGQTYTFLGKPKDDLRKDARLMEFNSIINKLQSLANDWIRQIRDFTKQADERAVGSASQEKNFWLAMESAIDSIEEQLAGSGVQLTMRILTTAT